MYNSRQQTDRASWTITSSSSTVNDSSLPTAGHSVIRGYGQYITRPVTCQPVSTTSCLHDSVAVRLHHVTRPAAAAAAAAAVEWTSHAAYQRSTPATFTDSTHNNWPQMYRAAASYRPSAGRLSLCHVDPARRGACAACEYIRVNTQLRYQPYSTRRYRAESQRVCYY